MKNIYFYFKKTTLLVLLLTIGVTSFSQTRKDTVLINFGALNSPDDATDDTDFEYFNITSDCGAVSNFKAEVIYQNYDFDSYIDRVRTPDGTVYSEGDDIFELDTVVQYASPPNWVIWLHEEAGTGDSALVRITYDFDSISPVAQCKDTSLLLDASGNATLTVSDIDDGSSGCTSLNITTFDCTNIGANTVTLTATGTDGSIETCTSTVNISNISCKDTAIYLDATGEATLEALDLMTDSTYSCGIIDTLWISQNTFECADVGSNSVTLFTKSGADTSMCVSTVSVMDTILPSVICQDVTIELDSTGSATISADTIDNGSSDACGIQSLSASQTSFSCSDIGANSVTLTVTDNNGNVSTCVATVTVEDNIAPTVNCQDITIQLDAAGSANIAASDIDNGSSDACGIQSLSASQTAFSCSDIGANSVTLTVTDNNGNVSTCAATVTVEDNVAPTANCQDIIIDLGSTGSATITADTIDNGSSDACGIASMTLDETTFGYSDIGSNTVELTVTDNNGNTNSCTANVTVIGVLSTLNCQDITVYLWANGQYVLKSRDIDSIATFDTSFGSTDDITVSVSPRSFDCIHANTAVKVKVTATDLGGNKNVCYANVTVKDTIVAEVSCIDSLEVYLDETGEARIFPGQIKDKLEEGDVCGSSSMWLSQSVFSCADIGTSMITLTSADPSGNESTCTTKIIVHDTFPPMVEEIEDIEIMVDAGVCETAIEYPVPVVMDNCDVSLEQTEGLGADGMFPLGTTTETWVITDEGGNSVTLSFSVIVTTTNDAPTLDEVEDVSVVEDTPTLNVELTGISGGMDCETQVVTVTAENSNTDLITEVMVNYTDGNTGSLDLTIAPEMSGEAEITVMVEDAEGAMDTAMFMVTVTAENDPPYLINPIPDQVVNASYALKIPVSTVVGEYFGDVDDDMLTFSAILDDGSDLPAWMMMSIDTLVAEPMIEDTGCVVVIVAATDAAGATATDTFEVCVDGYPVSIDEIDADQFEVKLYPNPTQGIVNIDISSSKIYDVELSVIDITGKQVLRKQYSAAERITFNLENNVSGMYFVKLNFDGKQVLKKVILDR